MQQEDHGRQAREFLEASDSEFDAGDHLQASEKLWGAATHAVMAVALQRDWPCRSHRALSNTVSRLQQEFGALPLRAGFGVAEKFHRNFYHDEMQDYEIEADRPTVHEFVNSLLALLEQPAG
ncbi:MAG: PaREP1/PaREP8 domain-containing protein [Chloroflexota bacterium]|nr:PaREP1/PaREP8 domain-containing protein [Chloroflexota bacterium]MDE2969913.1 PaREP1/PaREP8 domain-containing protein [Chloroflexota bacterium]